MSGVRETYVRLDIQDGATAPLNRIDGLLNQVVSNFQRLGNSTNNSFGGFRRINSEVARLTRNLNDSTREVSSLNRRLTASENEMSSLRNQSQRMEQELRDARDEISTMRTRLDQAEQEAQQLRQEMQRMAQNSQEANTSMVGLGATLRGMVGLVGTVFAVDKIKDFAVSGIELAAGTKALNSQFEQVYDGIETTATDSLNRIAKDTGILPDRLKGSFVQMAAFAKTTGADTAAALSISERATLAAADSAAFYDRSIEDVTENLQSFLKGNFENDAALGISATETTRNAKANALYGKSFTKLSESQKQLTLLAMVEEGNKAAGAIGQAARESDGFENVIGNLKGAWDGLKGTMMTPFLDTVTDGLQGLTSKIQSVDAEQLGLKLKSGFEGAKNVVVPTFHAVKDGIGFIMENKEPLIAGLAGITAGFLTLKVISTVNGLMAAYQASAFASTLATQGFNAALRANPIGLVVTGIGLLVAGGVMLYRNWDTVKAKAGELWATTKEKFAGIKAAVSGFIQPAISWFTSLNQKWNSFKNAISNFKVPEWMSKIGGAISGGAKKLASWAGADGSHATGLASVPRDGYRAELHAQESVLTANQSNALRAAGILSANSDGTPNVDLSPVISQVATVSTSVPGGGSIGIPPISFSFIVQGNADTNTIDQLKSIMSTEVRAILEDVFRKKLAGLEG